MKRKKETPTEIRRLVCYVIVVVTLPFIVFAHFASNNTAETLHWLSVIFFYLVGRFGFSDNRP